MVLHRVLICSLILGALGCDGFSPSDEPLPSFEELQRSYGSLPEGEGVIVSESEGRSRAPARFEARGEGSLAGVRIELHPEAGPIGAGGQIASIDLRNFDGVTLDDLRERRSVDASVAYGGRSGRGRLHVMSVSDDRLEAVFAADLKSGALAPFEATTYDRVEGGFDATLYVE